MLVAVDFRPSDYGPDVARLLTLDPAQARAELKALTPAQLFPAARSPHGAMCGLYLHHSLMDEAHAVAQDIATPEGSFWHGILHRREPDPVNAAYWFRKVGKHPVFPELRNEAHRLRFDTGPEWDPFEYIEFCEAARQRPGSEEERMANRIQLTEWQMLFDYCAREQTA